MRIPRSFGASAMSIAVLISSGVAMGISFLPSASAYAQSAPPPDLRMLLNLDLFKPDSNAEAQSGADGGDGSMFEQIRTLNALGYLGGNRPAPVHSNASGSAGGNTEEIAPATGNPPPQPIPEEPEGVE